MTEGEYRLGQSTNIFGKYYTFAETTNACATGYHVPTNAEWDALLVNLGCSVANKRV